MYVVKIVCQASLPSFLTSGNTLFRSMPNGDCLFSSASLSLVGDNSLLHELRVMTSVELHYMQMQHKCPTSRTEISL